MGDWESAIFWLDAAVREIALFAAFGFLIGGLDDLVVDGLYIFRRLQPRRRRLMVSDIEWRSLEGPFAIFVPVWREAEVIGPMLENLAKRLRHHPYRVYVGTYPNDPATVAAVRRVAAQRKAIRLVIGDQPGPTTKGGNLNTIYRALLRDENRELWRAHAVVLHDAEDVVHADELLVYDHLLRKHWVAQIPVLPLIEGASLIAATYGDDFAEQHAKQMVVRGAIGAALPLAGVGCAIRRDALDAVALTRENGPFDATSLTEDYEFGLHIASLGGSGAFARIAERPGGPPVAVRAYFPDRMTSAVRQKARWVNGISLSGWDRTGWAAPRAFADHWMRMRDRRAPLSALVILAGYTAIFGVLLSFGLHRIGALPPPRLSPGMRILLQLNAVLLLWRMVARFVFTRSAYGWRQGLLALPRMILGNFIALFAAMRALKIYTTGLSGTAVGWDKTDHIFPDLATIEAHR